MKSIFFLLLFVINLFANENYSFRIAYGKSTQSDLGEILLTNIQSDVKDLRVLSIDSGYLLKKNIFSHPIDLYLKSSLSYFDDVDKSIYEIAIYLKAYYTFSFLDKSMRFGFGEGSSYTTNVLRTESYGAFKAHDNVSKYLNYLDISLDIDLKSITGVTRLKNTYIGYLIKHRSGIFGLIHNVHHGGSNYNCITIEKNF